MSLSRISKIVIANRGEIACRIARTAKRMGIETVAVFSETDRNALHVKMANEAYCIGPAASQQSYLRSEKLLEVAQKANAQAIHPGYGFLSENLEFAGLCKRHNIIFIGPPESAIRDMGIKNTSKVIMEAAGVPVVLGYHGEGQSNEVLLSEAKKIGFPVMIKAIRGGGGKGMRIALTEKEFFEQLDSAKRESLKAFNDDNVLLEKFIETPRHVEVQIFGDSHGNYVHLCERDCSVQRRHQKIIEEAPGPHITTEIRNKLGDAAVRAASAVGYVGAGTVEFIMDSSHNFYFMEMNTRLQVEHPITEMITGLDLVEWQLRVAGGERLPIIDQSLISPRGHAFEARIYAEDCTNPDGFMPTAGTIERLSIPECNDRVRIDTGVVEGDEISVHYDPMIAKLVVWSHDRSSALRSLAMALKSFQIVGLPTNIEFLQSLTRHRSFIDGQVHTDFIKQHRETLFVDTPVTSAHFCVAASVMTIIDKQMSSMQRESDEDKYSPYSEGMCGYRVNHNYTRKMTLIDCASEKKLGASVCVEYDREREVLLVQAQMIDGSSDGSWCVSGTVTEVNGSRTRVRLCVDNATTDVDVYRCGMEMHLFIGGRHSVFREDISKLAIQCNESLGDSDDSGGGSRFGVSPMPGVIEKILVKSGQKVVKGDILVTLMAMKMEYSVRAGCDGVVSVVEVIEGQTVAKNAHLVEVKPLQ